MSETRTEVRCPRVGCDGHLTFDGASIDRFQGNRYFDCTFMCWSCGANGTFALKVSDSDDLGAMTGGQWTDEAIEAAEAKQRTQATEERMRLLAKQLSVR